MLTFTPSLPVPLASCDKTCRILPPTTTTSTPLRKPRSFQYHSSPSRCVPICVQQQMPPTSSSTSSAPSPSSSTSFSTSVSSKWLLAYLKNNKDLVDSALEASLSSESDDVSSSKLISSMRYSLLAGGKRVRPNLVIAAYEMFAGRAPSTSTFEQQKRHLSPVMPTALAVEMIHTMSLIHDDLPAMDNDGFRRGKPTNHKVYGEDIAILAGDALLAYAFEFVAKHTPSSNVEPHRIVQVLRMLAQSVGPEGLAGGQAMDLENEGRSNVSLDTLTWIHTHKTAVLLRVSVATGAILGGANDEDVKRVSDFATKVGLAFQIADDLLDVTQSTEVLGKTAGKDEATNKATYPRLLGLNGSRLQAEKLIIEAKQAMEPYGENANTLLALADFIINRQN